MICNPSRALKVVPPAISAISQVKDSKFKLAEDFTHKENVQMKVG